jgi:hypothetical protein
MIKLSEIIRTDCYIDCGSNEKLREVARLLKSKYKFKITYDGNNTNTFISVYADLLKFIITRTNWSDTYPAHHISQIDLNK